VIYDFPELQVIVKLMLTCETHESAKYYGTRGLLEISGGVITITPQDGKDHDPGWYQQGYPTAMREAYEKQWHLEHDAELPTKKPEPVVYRNPQPSRDLDHLGIFFEAVRTGNPKIVTEDAVFGNNAAIACHMANAAYFSRSVSVWDAKARKIRTARRRRFRNAQYWTWRRAYPRGFLRHRKAQELDELDLLGASLPTGV
jgi:hypothetical protein